MIRSVALHAPCHCRRFPGSVTKSPGALVGRRRWLWACCWGRRMAQSVDDGGRGARLARRDEGAYCWYVTEEQRGQTGCIGREGDRPSHSQALSERTPASSWVAHSQLLNLGQQHAARKMFGKGRRRTACLAGSPRGSERPHPQRFALFRERTIRESARLLRDENARPPEVSRCVGGMGTPQQREFGRGRLTGPIRSITARWRGWRGWCR